MSSIEVTGLFIYPLKSAQGLSVESLVMDERGPCWDREWMLIDEARNFISQRTHPHMCKIETAIEGQTLSFSAPGLTPISLPMDGPEIPLSAPVKIFGKDAAASATSKDLDAWFSTYLSQPVRLVRSFSQKPRTSSSKYDPQEAPLKFADGFPLLLATEESLKDLKSRVDAPLTMEHFRPNIVVKGAPAFAEDHWRHLKIGAGNFEGVKDCSRCVIVTVSPDTGKKHPEILKTLTDYRKVNGKILFGKNLSHRSKSPIHLGDPVFVKPLPEDA